MKYLEINDGVSVKKDEIILIEKIDDFSCNLTTESGIYECRFPYMTLLQILESDVEDKKEDYSAEIVNQLQLLNKNSQYFAG